jgi:hypothetical protein
MMRLLILALVLMFPGAAIAETQYFTYIVPLNANAVKASNMLEKFPDLNNGTATSFYIGNYGAGYLYVGAFALNFDLADSLNGTGGGDTTVTIDRAVIILKNAIATTPGHTMRLASIQYHDWVESPSKGITGITWNNYKTASPWQVAGGTGVLDQGTEWFDSVTVNGGLNSLDSLEFTALAQEWLDVDADTSRSTGGFFVRPFGTPPDASIPQYYSDDAATANMPIWRFEYHWEVPDAPADPGNRRPMAPFGQGEAGNFGDIRKSGFGGGED